MPEKLSVAKCPKCGYLPNILSNTCFKCNAPLEKICGGCGFANQMEKVRCDRCNSALILQLPAPREQAPRPPEAPENIPFKMEMESIQDTVYERATSFRRKPAAPPPPQPDGHVPPKPAGGAPRPAPGQGPASSLLSPNSARLPAQTGLPKPLRHGPLRRMLGPAITLILVSALLGIVYMIAAPSLPRLRLLMTAKSYLSSISEGNFEKAYSLLSTNSKAACTLEDYVKTSREYYANAPAWQFKDVQVFALYKDAAMIRYQLKEGDAEWKSDYISFVREHNYWTRPYIWMLFQPIDDALKRQDFSHALFLAQKLYLTDPIDPRTSGYLCVSEFSMGLYEKAAESCKRTIDAAVSYPVGYASEDLFWFNSHYADSLRYLQRDRVALAEYDKLLKWPGLAPAESCMLYLNRTDSYVTLKDYELALQDVMKAESLCPQGPSKEDAKKRLGYISGSAGNEAIAFAQKTRFRQGMPTIGEERRLQSEALKTRLGPKNARLLPKDQWLAVHMAGPEYRVFLRQESYNRQSRKTETQNIYVFLVNLWTGRVKLEKTPAAAKNGK